MNRHSCSRNRVCRDKLFAPKRRIRCADAVIENAAQVEIIYYGRRECKVFYLKLRFFWRGASSKTCAYGDNDETGHNHLAVSHASDKTPTALYAKPQNNYSGTAIF